MSTRFFTTFASLLTAFADVAIIGTAIIWVGSRFSRRLSAARSSLSAWVGPWALLLAFGVAASSMLATLYFSEVAHYSPCRLCWYQRAAMYPLVPMLGIAARRADRAVRPYAMTLAMIGLSISVYHYLLERFPSLETGACDPNNPCTLLWVWRFHFISIPFMGITAFASIALLLAATPGLADDSEWEPAYS